ncbi:EF-hand calcium-binding domain-containing protein 4B-like [Ornithodoros turicata]|uniref:EF-hand calcium-binding domain-containing protein 4B-like n=1 Tax=Ornithodoros turicata TaxID=34597 RepID=UPI0031392B65
MNKQGPSVTVAVIGESEVGKTTFINALAAGEEKQTDGFSAVGVDVRKRSIRIGRGLVTLIFWDTAGNVTTGYLQNLDVKKVDGFILMYRVYRWDTFAALLDSVDALQAHLGGKPVLIVGNKFGSRAADEAEVSWCNGEVLAKDLGANFFEVDACDDNQVRKVVQNWTNKVLSVLCTRERPLKAAIDEERPLKKTAVDEARPLKTSVDEDRPLQKRSDIPSSIPSVTRDGHHRHFKVILVGNSKVGKTSFVMRLVTGKFQETQSTKPKFDIVRHDIDVEGHTVKLQIWDTAAQERFQTMPEQYYRRAEGAIVMYDITCKESYVDASKWAAEIKKRSSVQPVLVVVGSKEDLTGSREVKAKEGEKLAHTLSSPTMTVAFFEVSAKTGFTVLRAVTHLALQMLRAEDSDVHDVFQLQSQAGQPRKRKCCSK